MTTNELRSLRDAHPFRPFTIRMAGGRSLPVPHRDFVSISPAGRTVIVYEAGDGFSIVDMLLVAEFSVEDQPSTPPANGGV